MLRSTLLEEVFASRNKALFPLQKIKEGEVDTILLCLKEKTKIKGKRRGRKEKKKKTWGKQKENAVRVQSSSNTVKYGL